MRSTGVQLLFLLLGTALPAREQPQVTITPRARPAPVQPASNFRLDVKLVEIPVTVTDFREQPVLGLQKDDFRLFEDNVEQQVVSFSQTDTPVSVGLVFDTSNSMKNRIAAGRRAVGQFLKTALPEDEFFLVSFSDRPELLSPFTPDPEEILRRLSTVTPHGWTALFDALCLSIQQMHHAARPRKALLVFSDGEDNNSRYSGQEMLSRLREADVSIYAIGLQQRSRYLEKLADETGGKLIWVHDLGELPDAIDRLSRQMRTEYLLGYIPKTSLNDGRYHKIRVQVQPSAGSVQVYTSWRRGYFAPGE